LLNSVEFCNFVVFWVMLYQLDLNWCLS